MPQIIVKGISGRQAEKMSKDCCRKLGRICRCPSDWFVFDHIQSDFYDESGKIAHWPVAQVWWFARTQEVQDAVAQLLNDYFKELGYPGSQISFHIFEYSSYYEDGQHF